MKHGTSRKVKGTFTVLWDVSPDAGADIVLASSSVKARFVAMYNPSEGRWYQRFAMGCCARMGDVPRKNRTCTIEVLLKLFEIFEDEYQELGTSMPHHSICACMFPLVTCLGGMREYEAMWTDELGLRYDIEFCEESADYTSVP